VKYKVLLFIIFVLFSFFYFKTPSASFAQTTGALCCPAGYGDGFFDCPFIHDKPCCHWDSLFSYSFQDKVACFVGVNTPCGGATSTSCNTAIGKINTTGGGFVTSIFGIILSIAGTVAILLIILSGYRLMSSQGNPERVQQAREQLTSAIIGLLFIIFSFFLIQVIGGDVLKIF
jgi:Type IV secretion system pilin